MSKKPVPVEEPGSRPAVAPAVDDSDPATLIEDLDAPQIQEVSAPLIVESTEHLPATVDPAKISAMTLTKDGWVVPDSATKQAAG